MKTGRGRIRFVRKFSSRQGLLVLALMVGLLLLMLISFWALGLIPFDTDVLISPISQR